MFSRSKSSSWTQWCNGAGGRHSQKSARRVLLLNLLTVSPSSLVNLRHPLQLTDQFEGSLIRVFRRLQELIRQMAQAARVIGNVELQQKFEKASEMLERPNSVIFASSLYL